MPGVFDRTLGRLGGKAQQAVSMVSIPTGHAGFPNLHYESYVREGYQKNELVFACIDEWATDIAEPDIRAYIGPQEDQEATSSGCVELLNNPNPFLSGDDYISGVEMYKRLAGNSFTLKVRSGARKVVQLWLLRPDRVRIVAHREKYISHYEYRIGPDMYEIPVEDVIHHKTRNPYDEFYGMPPLMPAAGRTDIDNFMRDMVKGVLENMGVPAGILQISGKLSDQEKGLLRLRFKTDFTGANAGNIIVSDGGSDAPKYTPLGMPLGARGLVIPELDEIDEVRIPMVFRVPQSILGTRLGQGSSSYANRVSDREFFTEQQLVPEWKSLAAVFTQQLLLPDFGDADRLEYDMATVRAFQQDEDALFTRWGLGIQHTLASIEEGRAALGLPEKPNPRHHFAVPFNFTLKTWDEIQNPEPLPLPGGELPAPQPSMNGTGASI